MFFSKLKRDLYTIYLVSVFFSHYIKKHYAKCFAVAAQIEFLESNISYAVAKMLFSIMRNKYEITECGAGDPYVNHVKERFESGGSKQFLQNDLLFIKPYISEKEKGVLMVKYSEIVNALPFLFDLHKLEQRYHLVLEQSSESPFQPFNGFMPVDSLVFIQSVSERERKIHKQHGLIPVPLTSGDWVNKKNFFHDDSYGHVYDFCVVSNFIPLKRYPFLFASLRKYWKGDLKFAIVASKHLGRDKSWIDNLIKEYGLEGKVDVFIEIHPTEVNKILNQSYCHVMCSLREGSPKVNFESMIAGTPVVIYKHHIGFPNWRFTPPMVINYTDGKSLIDAIKECAKVDKNHVAQMASQLIGSARATEILNEEIKKAALSRGEQWTMDILEKVNNVHTFYKNPADVTKCIADYHFLESTVFNKATYSAEEAIKMHSPK